MTLAVIILTVGILLLVISQIATVYLVLRYVKVAPKIQITGDDDMNDFSEVEEDKYLDLSEVDPEEGLKAIKKINIK